jgi:hypothetical protein
MASRRAQLSVPPLHWRYPVIPPLPPPGFGKTPALPYSDNNMRSELIKTVIETAWPKVNSSIYLISPSMSG